MGILFSFKPKDAEAMASRVIELLEDDDFEKDHGKNTSSQARSSKELNTVVTM